MRIVSLTAENQELIIEEAVGLLEKGGIIVAPTDTVYGILGSATDAEAIKKVFALKGRPKQKAFPVFARDIAQARKLAYISDKKAKFLEKIWPGPTTIVFHHKEKLPGILTTGKDTIGIRIPSYPFLLELLARVDFPLVQTSANISDKPPAKNLDEIKLYFAGAREKPDLVIDGGEIQSAPSAVFDLTGSEPKVLRLGMMSKEEFDRISKTMI